MKQYENVNPSEFVSSLTFDKNPFDKELQEYKKLLSEESDKKTELERRLKKLIPRHQPTPPDNHTGAIAGWSYGITGAVVVALFVIHCIKWVLNIIFNIGWDTWGWTTTAFKWGIGISTIATLVALVVYANKKNKYDNDMNLYFDYVNNKDTYKSNISESNTAINELQNEIKKIVSARFKVLGYAIHTNLAIPFSDSIANEYDYSKFKQRYFDLIDKQQSISAIANEAERQMAERLFLDEKLKFFYEISLKNEVCDKIVYNEFKNIVDNVKDNDVNKLRFEIRTKNSPGLTMIEKLPTYKDLLYDNTLEGILDEFKEIQSRDTSRMLLFTNTQKKATQSYDMQKVLNAARNEYKEICSINESVSYVLRFVRGCAYRNIYLGVELINYIRTNSGGSTLTAVQDSIIIPKVSTSTKSYTKAELESHTGKTFSVELDRLADMASKLDNNFTYENPNLANAAGVIVAFEVMNSFITVLDSHISQVEKNEEFQRNMTKEMNDLANSYNEAQGQMLRAIEIAESIVNANRGFMNIYEPLRDKVLIHNDSVSRDELIQLAAAMKEYKRISDATIN